MSSKRTITAAVVVAFAAALASYGSAAARSTAASTTSASGKTLQVVLPGPVPPYSFQKNGHNAGADIELFEASARAAGYSSFKYSVQKNYDAIIPAILAHRFDVALALAGDIASRHGVIWITDEYDTPWLIIGPKSITSPKQLCGKRIGVVKGGQSQIDAIKVWNNLNCKGNSAITVGSSTSGADQHIPALAAHRIDAFLSDGATLPSLLKERKDLHGIGKSFDAPGTKYGWIVEKRNANLAKALQKGLKKTIASGQYERILKKWNLWTCCKYTAATMNAG